MALILKLVSFKSHLDAGRLGNSGIIENGTDNKKSVVCMSLGCVGRLGISGIHVSRPLIAQDKLFHRQNAVRNFLIPST